MPSSPSYTEARREALRLSRLSFVHEGIEYARHCIETERFSKREASASPDQGVCYKMKREEAASKGRPSFSHDGVLYERVGTSSSYRASRRPAEKRASSKRPAAKRSKRPAAKRSKRTATKRSKRPATKRSKRPAAKRSKRPATKRSKRPATKRSKRPAAKRSKRTAAKRSKSPAAKRSKRPAAKRSKRPAAKRASSKRPAAKRSKSPAAKRASSKSKTVSKANTSRAPQTSKAAKHAQKAQKAQTAKAAPANPESAGKHDDALSSVEGYNKTMRSLSSLGINPSTLLDLGAATPIKEYTLDEAVSKLKQTFSFDDDVSTNGIMAEVVRSIVAEKHKGDLVDALIVASRAKTTVLIKEETNAYTSGATVKRHFNTTQRIGSSAEYVCVHGDDGACAKVHFLNWVVMTAPPLIFLVPTNCVVGQQAGGSLEESIAEGYRFYATLRSRLPQGATRADARDDILYRPLGTTPLLEEFRALARKANKCKMALFPYDDGFADTSTADDLSRLAVTDCLYGHKYLDPRHLLTILAGTQNDTRYRINHRRALIALCPRADEDVRTRIQLFTRIKLAEHELTKLSEECQKRALSR